MIRVVTEDALDALNELSRNATVIRSAVAYWTYPVDRIDPAFVRGLGGNDGFLCCDIHSPTSISVLGDFYTRKANVFLHLYQLAGRTEVFDSKGIPDNLMHSKVFLFEGNSDQCGIWVGSHNGTARALLGINHECSVVLSCAKASDTYAEVRSHLERIRDLCTRFKLDDVDHYRLLQGGSNAEGVIEAIDEHQSDLSPGTEVSFFGVHKEDYALLKSVGKRVYLAITSRSTGAEAIYEAEIKQTGEMESKRSRAVIFDARRYAFRATRTIPTLEPHQEIPQSVYKAAMFFVTLRVGQVMKDVVAVEAPPDSPWHDEPLEIYLQSRRVVTEIAAGQESALPTRSERRELVTRDFPSGRRVKIQHALAPSQMATKSPSEQLGWQRAYTVLSLESRETLPVHRLVRRRIIKRLSEQSDATD